MKLARIIRSEDILVDDTPYSAQVKVQDDAASKHDSSLAEKTSADVSTSSKPKPTTSSIAAARLGSSARDASPSLARDIASRRGIPQPARTPPSAAAKARARQLSPESHRRSRSNVVPAPKIPPSVMDSQTLNPKQKAKKAEDDDAFAHFYNQLTTGTISKLSSVLAYAGLPLTADDVKNEQILKEKTKNTVSASNEPDVKKIFSKAALDAIEDDHRQRGHHGQAFGPAESFYVVQTSGGTQSYANIAKGPLQQLGGIEEDDEGEFVDAREAQMPDSPRHSRLRSQQARSSFGKSRTLEELELENVTLKQTLEQLAHRLTEFENHAQDASMAALTQSMISQPGVPAAGAPSTVDPALISRLRQIEQQLEQETEERQRLSLLAAKQEKSLKKYQSKWDEIKTSALEKQKAKNERKAAEDGSKAPAMEGS